MSYLSFLGNLFGYRPEQNVEPSEWEGLKNSVAVGLKDGSISKAQAQELMGTFKLSIGEKARKFVEMVEAAIKLTPSDRINTKNHEVQPIAVEVPKKSEKVRNDDRLIGE